MSSKNKKKIKKAFPYIIIAVLLISDLFLLFRKPEEKIVSKTEDFTFYQKCTDLDYNEDKKYYKEINYSKFKKLYKKDTVYNIAVIDNTSNTYDSYLSLLNHVAYYKSTNIFVLDLSKLSKKNNIAFYEIDERLSKIEGNYMITTKDSAIIAITEIEPSQIGSLIKEME
ncbi:MAG: hypothetical protein ACI4WW_00910 [Candidatus Coprovivens sp.]